MNIDGREIVLRVIIGGILAIGCFSLFQFVFPYHLFIKEQNQLFLLTSGYFLSYFGKPASFACYIGDFLTQFFYLRGGGAVVLTIVLLLEWFLFTQVLKKFGIELKAMLFALIPVLIECLLHCQLSYTLSATVSVILVLLLFLLYTGLRHKGLSVIVGLLLLPLLYVFAGAAFFLFLILVIAYEISQRQWRWVYWLCLTGICCVLPGVVRNFYLQTVHQAYSYPFTSVRLSSVSITNEKIFALSSEAYFERWDHVLELVDDYQMKHPIATYYTNLALSKRNELPDKLLDYYQPATQGFFLPVNPSSSPLDIFFSSDIYFHLGDMNMAQHSAMLGMIFSPKHRSTRMVKRLAEINLVLGDSVVARKYLRMLETTMFHRRWAEKRINRLIAPQPDDWLIEKRSQIPTLDRLRTASDNEASLNVLVASNPDNMYAMHYLLCYYLLNKDLPSFYRTYKAWCKGNPLYLSRIYCEALLVVLSREKISKKEMESYAIPNPVANDFVEYTQLFEEHEGDIEILREKYEKSYWFYFHYATMIEK